MYRELYQDGGSLPPHHCLGPSELGKVGCPLVWPLIPSDLEDKTAGSFVLRDKPPAPAGYLSWCLAQLGNVPGFPGPGRRVTEQAPVTATAAQAFQT